MNAKEREGIQNLLSERERERERSFLATSVHERERERKKTWFTLHNIHSMLQNFAEYSINAAKYLLMFFEK